MKRPKLPPDPVYYLVRLPNGNFVTATVPPYGESLVAFRGTTGARIWCRNAVRSSTVDLVEAPLSVIYLNAPKVDHIAVLDGSGNTVGHHPIDQRPIAEPEPAPAPDPESPAEPKKRTRKKANDS